MAYIRKILFLLPVFICIPLILGTTDSKGQKADKNRPQSVMLYCRLKHQIYEQSVFNFDFGVNGVSGRKKTRNHWNISYGSLRMNKDMDFFQVRFGNPDCSRIIDLGENNWSEINEKEILEENQFSEKPQPCPAGIMSPSIESGLSITDVNVHLAKALQGHMYLVHNLAADANMYSLFRVDELVPGDTCTISWKVIKRGKFPSWMTEN
jgi:hypothetical protein